MIPAKRVIAVTGASRGIGAEIALELARRAFTVGCLTRKGQGPEIAEAKQYAERLVNVACDMTDTFRRRFPTSCFATRKRHKQH